MPLSPKLIKVDSDIFVISRNPDIRRVSQRRCAHCASNFKLKLHGGENSVVSLVDQVSCETVLTRGIGFGRERTLPKPRLFLFFRDIITFAQRFYFALRRQHHFTFAVPCIAPHSHLHISMNQAPRTKHEERHGSPAGSLRLSLRRGCAGLVAENSFTKAISRQPLLQLYNARAYSTTTSAPWYPAMDGIE